MQIWDLFDEWMLAARAANLSPNTLAYYRQNVYRFIEFLKEGGQSTDCEDLDAGVFRRFMVESSERFAPQTVHGNIKVLKTMFRFAEEEELLDENPTRRVKLPALPKPIIESFTTEEIDRLLQACDRRTWLGTRDFAIVIVLFDSGIRATELTRLLDDDIDYQRGLLKVRGKGAKERYVPISPRTLRAMKRYQRRRNDAGHGRRGHLFVNLVGDPMTRSGLLQMTYRLGDRTGLRVHPHKFRHSYAVNALRNGAREFDIQACLGHTTLTTTRHYARQVIGDLADAHRRFSPADRLRTRV